MKTKSVCLLDNISSYLYNAFTFGSNNIFEDTSKKDIAKVTNGVVLGDPVEVIANKNVKVYPLYEPKIARSNYVYNPNGTALSTMLTDYIEPTQQDKLIKGYEVLKFYVKQEDALISGDFSNDNYVTYLSLMSYLHLYKFQTKADELNKFMFDKAPNVPVINYMDFTNKYIVKKVKQATVIHSDKYDAVAIANADNDLQLIAKSLAHSYNVALVHKGQFIMLCFNKNFTKREEFTKLLVDNYTVQGDFTTFFLNQVEPDAIVTAISRLV